ncbi:MAG: PD-(D/E)XK nuclease family protein, partial [Pseudomonadota bacterium]
MTRAEQWLIVAGAGKQGDDCWYSHIADGLLRMDTPPATEDLAGVGTIQRVQSPEWALNPGTAFGGVDTALPSLPAWLDSPVAPAVPPSRHQSPSRLPGPKALPGGDGLPEEEALRRGRQVHLLLEHLPGTPDRAGLATRLLVDDLLATADERAALLVEAARIIDDPAFAWLFAPGVLAEVGVTGDVPGVGPMEGVIDRLVIGPDRVLVVYFKTNARLPATVPEVPLGILRQMAAYRVMVSALFPDQEVEIAVLWTATGTLMSIPHDAVNGVLDRMGDP